MEEGLLGFYVGWLVIVWNGSMVKVLLCWLVSAVGLAAFRVSWWEGYWVGWEGVLIEGKVSFLWVE